MRRDKFFRVGEVHDESINVLKMHASKSKDSELMRITRNFERNFQDAYMDAAETMTQRSDVRGVR